MFLILTHRFAIKHGKMPQVSSAVNTSSGVIDIEGNGAARVVEDLLERLALMIFYFLRRPHFVPAEFAQDRSRLA